MVVFGDSLSDNGNAFRKFFNMVPGNPFWKGRFSNGEIWTDLIAKKLAVLNLAEGGSTINDYKSRCNFENETVNMMC